MWRRANQAEIINFPATISCQPEADQPLAGNKLLQVTRG